MGILVRPEPWKQILIILFMLCIVNLAVLKLSVEDAFSVEIRVLFSFVTW